MKIDEIKTLLNERFYNPFKPNIYYSGENGYVIRRMTILGWEHLDKDYWSLFWWTGTNYRDKYCLFKTYEGAKERLEEYQERIKKKKFFRVTKEQS